MGGTFIGGGPSALPTCGCMHENPASYPRGGGGTKVTRMLYMNG